MKEPQDASTAPKTVSACIVLGLLCIAVVPGIGWLWGQFWETVALCAGITLLLYVAVGYFSAVNTRLAALEKRLTDKDRARG